MHGKVSGLFRVHWGRAPRSAFAHTRTQPMSGVNRAVPVQFLRTVLEPEDWVAMFLKSDQSGGIAHRVGPLSWVQSEPFQRWLRAMNAGKYNIIYVSVNAIRPQRKARTREAIGDVRHVFLDVDRDGQHVLAAIGARRDLPIPSYVLHSSPNRLHVLWRATGFTRETVEALQKQLARELNTDKAATSCAQTTRRVRKGSQGKICKDCCVDAGGAVSPSELSRIPAQPTTRVRLEPGPPLGQASAMDPLPRPLAFFLLLVPAGSTGNSRTSLTSGMY